jgi:hypothetical protein
MMTLQSLSGAKRWLAAAGCYDIGQGGGTMTFSCPNYDFDAEGCRKLRLECIPTRPGCVLKGKIKVSEDIEKRLRQLDKTTARKKLGKHAKASGRRPAH